jgi:HSP20 family protein
MELVRWKPVTGYGLMHRFDDWFDDFFRARDLFAPEGLPGWRPAVDVFDADDKYVIKAELPGVDKKNISVDVKGDVLTIRGERSEEHEADEKSYHRKERFRGSFERCFNLGEGIDPEKISADYADGVLKIEVPKPAARQVKQITVH